MRRYGKKVIHYAPAGRAPFCKITSVLFYEGDRDRAMREQRNSSTNITKVTCPTCRKVIERIAGTWP